MNPVSREPGEGATAWQMASRRHEAGNGSKQLRRLEQKKALAAVPEAWKAYLEEIDEPKA